jgi:CHASE3 domain sensor protein
MKCRGFVRKEIIESADIVSGAIERDLVKSSILPMYENLRTFISNLSIRQKSSVVISIPLIALVASAGLFSYTERKSELAKAWVKHTLQVETDVYQLTFAVLGAQSAVRDAPTTDARDVPKYKTARRKISELLARVEQLTIDNPGQHARVKRLHSALDDMLARLDAPSNEAKDSAHDLTYEQWVKQRGIRMNQIVQMVASILREEELLLKSRTDEQNREHWIFHLAMQASFGLAFLGTLLAAGLFTEGIIRKIRGLEKNSGRLAQGLPFAPLRSGNDEIGRLGMAKESPTGSGSALRRVR